MNDKLSRQASGRREDGAATKLQILEAGGEVFADKGFDRATGKEIAEKAGSNSAAINYYYGSFEGLYAEVLVEAHRRLLAYEQLASIVQSPEDPADKLRAVIERLFRAIVGPTSATWPLRVLSREVLAPSQAFRALLERELLPKRRLAVGLFSEILGVSPDDPAAARCLLNIAAPFVLLLIGGRQFLTKMFPGLISNDPEAIQALIAHLQRFALAGLSATAAEIKASGRRTTSKHKRDANTKP
jgi:TetR/AcrR family transcriptional regulator, regulator of cefoperazone and chloramphenicol sensitivity